MFLLINFKLVFFFPSSLRPDLRGHYNDSYNQHPLVMIVDLLLFLTND